MRVVANMQYNPVFSTPPVKREQKAGYWPEGMYFIGAVLSTLRVRGMEMYWITNNYVSVGELEQSRLDSL